MIKQINTAFIKRKEILSEGTDSFRAFDGADYSDPATITVNLKTDPLYQHQWHLHNYGQKNFASGPSAAGFDLNVDTVIADGYTGSGVLVSVVVEIWYLHLFVFGFVFVAWCACRVTRANVYLCWFALPRRMPPWCGTLF